MPRRVSKKPDRITEAPVPAEELQQPFPPIELPIQPPFPAAEAKSVEEIPRGENWLYEPKWDGFRCLVFRKGREVLLQSKAGQPLGRYFPELVTAFSALPAKQFVLDGEIVIFSDGVLSFDHLLLRIHPAASRTRRLAAETPATFVAFDFLVDSRGRSLLNEPLHTRREALEQFFSKFCHLERSERSACLLETSKPETSKPASRIRLSLATDSYSHAQRWMKDGASFGLDGVIAKRADLPYASGERTAMQKIKRIRTADCVVGGFRYASVGRTPSSAKNKEKAIGSLLLGLYNQRGRLDHIGFSSSFTAEQRRELKPIVEELRGGSGFSGKAPGGPSRWSSERSGEWEPLKPKLVCEVRYDHFSGGRFRHGVKFLRWRPDKDPRQCTFDQVQPRRSPRGAGVLADIA